jgi:hypothetical protein
MSVTWLLAFKVTSDKKSLADNSTLNIELTDFTSQGASIEQILSQIDKNEKTNTGQVLTKALKKYGSAPTNELSIIFTDDGQATSFGNVVKKQIQDHVKVIIAQINTKLNVKDLFKIPNINVKVNSKLIGNSTESNSEVQQEKNNLEVINNDISQIEDFIKKYNNTQDVQIKQKLVKAQNLLKDLYKQKNLAVLK